MNGIHPRRVVLATAILLASLLAACGSGNAQSENLAATERALSATQQALEEQQQRPSDQQPQRGLGAPATDEVEEQEPEQEVDDSPVAEDKGPYYVEEFSEPPMDWTYYLLSGDSRDFQLYTERDRLVFDIKGEYIWAYYTYDNYTYGDVRVDFRAKNLGNNNNNVSLICRASDRGWYEFNVANNGLYAIYRYTASDNNFRELYSGGVANMRIGKETNDYTMICKGNRLTLGMNGVEIRTIEDNLFEEGFAGVGVSSFDGTPVLVEMEYVEISQP